MAVIEEGRTNVVNLVQLENAKFSNVVTEEGIFREVMPQHSKKAYTPMEVTS